MEIQEKSELSLEELNHLITKVFRQLTLIKDVDLKPFLPAAKSLIDDSDDWLYISCALHADTLIWSNDNDFGQQKRIKIVTTKELIALVGSL